MIEAVGIDEILKDLNHLQEKIDDLTPIMREIGNFILNSSEDSFERQASPFGKKWKPNRIRTIHKSYGKKTHTKRGKQTSSFLRYANGKQILIDTGRLKSSFTVDADNGSVSVGTNVVYAAIHQFGGDAGRGKKVKIPARPFMPITKDGDMPNELVSEIMEYLSDMVMKD